MKIYIEKIGKSFRVHSPELQQIKESIFFVDNIECKSGNVSDALSDFNEFILREFIEFFVNEHGGNLTDLPYYRNVEYIFDSDSFENYYLADPTVYTKERHPKTPKRNRNPFYEKILSGEIVVEEKLSGDSLVPDLEHADPNSPFYDKKVVFTGVLESISRSEAAEIVKAMGADINNSISSLTDYVIVGADAGPSKLKKIEDCNAKGANIRVIFESEFLKMIK
uniref:BRCT domain-containing protein n=1 Tax=Alistipes putredinis TaxID=28117 RepID=UPI003FD814B9